MKEIAKYEYFKNLINNVIRKKINGAKSLSAELFLQICEQKIVNVG